MNKLNAQQLRKSKPSEKELNKINRNPIYLVLDRIIDTYNVGSLFRLADAIAATKVFLCDPACSGATDKNVQGQIQ